MNYIRIALNFLTGTYAKFGTSSNLVREVTLSVLTAVAVAVLVQLLTPKTPSPIVEVRDLLTTVLAAQHRADSVLGRAKQWQLQSRIDSLTQVIQNHHEQDSMRANAGLSDLEAMRRINGAIGRSRATSRH